MKTNNFGEKIWRFIKVIYFLLSAGIILIYLSSTFGENGSFTIKKIFGPESWRDYYNIFNYYEYIFHSLVVLLSYVIITDILARLSSYIGKGNFKGFIPYKTIFIKFWYFIVLYIFALCSTYLLGIHKKNVAEAYCSEKGSILMPDRICICERGYTMVDNKCVIKPEEFLRTNLEEKIQNYLVLSPTDTAKEVRVIDFQMIDETYGMGLAVKIENESLPPKEDLSGLTYDESCFSFVEGLGSVTGKASVFSFRKYQDDIEIIKVEPIRTWGYSYHGDVSLTYPIINTKQSNYDRYAGPKPLSESDGNRLERTKIINFRDINGDGDASEFFLITHYDLMCGLDNYSVVGFNKERKSPIFYDFTDDKGSLDRWAELSWGSEGVFFDGKIKQKRICGSNIAGSNNESWEYIYNPDRKVFEMKNYNARKCREDEML